MKFLPLFLTPNLSRPGVTSYILILMLISDYGFAAGVPSLAINTDTIEVSAASEGLIGAASSATEGTISHKQLENRPFLRPAEVLEVVPGLIISQHSGDGKANQYYLRGFNLDHGTDFATSLMGMPINMPTHGHGQGYSDLQFLIPELVDSIQYRKGSYSAEQGDFATAGSAKIEYMRQLDEHFAKAELGEHGYRRSLLAGSPQLADGHLLYALEWSANDGPWVLPEGLHKLNALLRYSQGSHANGWSVAGMAYQSDWNATDQVPVRAIQTGLISRYGNLDPTDGGKTSRYSLSAEWSNSTNDKWQRANAYIINSNLNLWSNFTFCQDSIALTGNCNRGDQFGQVDRRTVYGFNAANTWYTNWLGESSDFTLGMQSRVDDIHAVGLNLSTARQVWATISKDKVKQASMSAYMENQTQWLEKFRSIAGIREDFYFFDVNSAPLPANSGNTQAHITSPKLSFILGPWYNTEYYLNAGYGFHSNDARGVVAKINPDPRDPDYLNTIQAASPLVRAKSYEIGLRSAILPHLQSTLALWQLDLASELVFSGDANTTEPSFASRRKGIEWSNYWTPSSKLTVDSDVALSRARYKQIDSSVTGYYIPGAIEQTVSIGATYDSHNAWSGGLRLRYFGPRALIEDNSVRSSSSTLVNLNLGYKLDKNIKLEINILNLFDRQVSDIDYFYSSQLSNEPSATDAIHTHPAEPRTLRASIRVDY